MAYIKFISKIDEEIWNELRALAQTSRRTITDLLSEAVSEYVRRRRVRPEVLRHIEESMAENRDLGCRLAR